MRVADRFKCANGSGV